MSLKVPYGTWDSPITGDTVVSKTITFDDVLVDSVTLSIYHIEERPEDNARCVVVDSEKNIDVLPSPYSARTLVQDYGGSPAIVHDSTIYFSYYSGDSSKPDNRLYALKIGNNEATPLTPGTTEKNPYRYANFALHPTQSNLLVTLREDHTDDPNGDHPENVVNTVCVVDTTAASVNVTVIIDGAGFYASPAFNQSGTELAWQEWNLPWMPWQGGVVKYASVSIDSGALTVSKDAVLVAGDINGTVSAAFPRWITGSDTTLVYISDGGKNKFQNPYIYDTGTQKSALALSAELDQDFCEPEWTLGLDPYAILGGGKYGAFTAFKDGKNILYILDLTTPSDPIQIRNFDFTVAQHVRTASESSFVFTGSKAVSPGGVVLATVSSTAGYTVDFEILKASADQSDLERFVSKPRPITLTASGGYPIYVVYYAPYNPNYFGPCNSAEKPPCIVGVHGGPTALEPQALNWIKMFFTSRGFAWLDVNYRGSSGYGRDYSDLLYGHWGRYDVADCKEAATILAAAPYSLIDGDRVAIRGGSAGAYVTLSSVTFAPTDIRTFYKSACGTNGCIADVVKLTTSSEKFELDYAKELLGPESEWESVNPVNFAENIVIPLLVLQGLEDGVVPADELRNFLAESAKYAPTGEYKFYPGEGHHWKLASHITNALSREYHWYLDTLLQPETTT